jgi:hypothetical protein
MTHRSSCAVRFLSGGHVVVRLRALCFNIAMLSGGLREALNEFCQNDPPGISPNRILTIGPVLNTFSTALVAGIAT